MDLLKPLTGSLTTDAILVVFVVCTLISVRSYYRLSHVPGPPLFGWSSYFLFRLHQTGLIDQKFREFNDKYGRLARIGPNSLLTSDPDQLRLMSAPRSPYTRANWFLALRFIPGEDNILSTRDEKLHEDKRRKMAAGYAGKENVSLEQDIDDCILDLVDLIEKKYVSKPGGQFVPMDLAQKALFFTTDVTSKLAFDANFHDLRDDRDNHGYIHEVETIVPNIFCLCTIPNTLNFFTKIGLLKLVSPAAGAQLGLGKLLTITQEQAAKRFGDGKTKLDKRDMVGSFIRHGLSQKDVEMEAVLQMTAGTDTTATGIRAIFMCILTNPPAYAKLMTEINEGLVSGKISSDKVISDVQAKQLPYLQACIKEGLRWNPPIAGTLPKKVPPEGAVVNGYRLPGGVDIGYSALGVARNKALFGPDENVFRPERWILTSEGGHELSAEKIKQMERNNDLIFGYGKYQCLGKSVAFIELNKVFVELLRRFEITLQNPTHPWDSRCFGAHLQKNMWVVIKKRKQT